MRLKTIFLVTTMALTAGADAADMGPWQPAANGLAVTVKANNNSFMQMTLTCSKDGGFQARLTSLRFNYRLTGMLADSGGQKNVPLTPGHKKLYDTVFQLGGVDALERSLLGSESIQLILKIQDNEDNLLAFHFPGIAATGQQILAICPPRAG